MCTQLQCRCRYRSYRGACTLSSDSNIIYAAHCNQEHLYGKTFSQDRCCLLWDVGNGQEVISVALVCKPFMLTCSCIVLL